MPTTYREKKTDSDKGTKRVFPGLVKIRQYIILKGILLPLVFAFGCTLDRSGQFGCPEDGKISCNVFDISYAFDSKEHKYNFKGTCTLSEDENKSELSSPGLKFAVRGVWNRTSKIFTESVVADVKAHETIDPGKVEWSITGMSLQDPWLNLSWPTAVSAYSGDPMGFAKALCIASVPKEYNRIPFSRNVIAHMLSLQQIIALQQEAVTAAKTSSSPPPPPPPPCAPQYVNGASEIFMPQKNMAYKDGVTGITVAVRTKCGAQTVDYQKSQYGVVFEHYTSGSGWKEYRNFKIPMSYYPAGGSQGVATLPLNKSGLWRVKVNHYLSFKGKSTGSYGKWSDWVHFQIGKANMAWSAIKTSTAVQNLKREPMQRLKKDETTLYRTLPVRQKTPSIRIKPQGMRRSQ